MNKPICTIVIPAYNEEKTVRRVVKVALKTANVTEVIVVNDGSKDKTRQNIADLPIKIIDHPKNMGYTKAMHHGIKVAKGPVVAVIDADWKNVTTQAIEKIISPVVEDKADLVKASFNMARGRVTEFAVKPMMRILFPDFEMNQPISGQFAGRKSFLVDVTADNSWGIAIGILIEAINAGHRVMEVEIGELVHKARTTEEKALMAKEVLETMIKKAGLIQHKYKLVLFTIDGAILKKTTLKRIYTDLGIYNQITKLQKQSADGEISFKKYIEASAMLFKGISVEKVENTVLKYPVQDYSEDVIRALLRRKYKVSLVSMNFAPIVKSISKKIGIGEVDCIGLEQKNGILTGKVAGSSVHKWLSCDRSEAFKKAFVRVTHKSQVKPSEVVMVANSSGWRVVLEKTGLSIAYRPETKEVKELVDKTISTLPEILAIIE